MEANSIEMKDGNPSSPATQSELGDQPIPSPSAVSELSADTPPQLKVQRKAQRIKECFKAVPGMQKNQSKYCSKICAVSTSTSSLQYHLQIMHPILWKKISGSLEEKRVLPKEFQQAIEGPSWKKLSKNQQLRGVLHSWSRILLLSDSNS